MGLGFIALFLYGIYRTLESILSEMKHPRRLARWRKARIEAGNYDPEEEPDWL